MSLHREIIVAEAYGNLVAYVRKNLKLFTMLPPAETQLVSFVARETFVHALEESGIMTVSNAKTGLIVKRWQLDLEGTPHAMCIPRDNSSMAWISVCDEGIIRIYRVDFENYACDLQYSIDYDVDVKHAGRLYCTKEHLVVVVFQLTKELRRDHLTLITVSGDVQNLQGTLKEHSIIAEDIAYHQSADRNPNLVAYLRHDDPVVYLYDVKHDSIAREFKANIDFNGEPRCVHVNEDGTLLAAGFNRDDNNGCMYWWNVKTGNGRQINGLPKPTHQITSTKTVVICVLNQVGWISFDIESGRPLQVRQWPHPMIALDRFFSRDNKVYAVVDKDAHAMMAGLSPVVFSFPLEGEGLPYNFDQTYFWVVAKTARWRNQVIINRAQRFTNVVTAKGPEGCFQLSGTATGGFVTDGDKNLVYHALMPNGILLYQYPGVDIKMLGAQSGLPAGGIQLSEPAVAVIGVSGNFLVYQYYGKSGFQIMNLATNDVVFEVECALKQPKAYLFKQGQGLRVVIQEFFTDLFVWDLPGQNPKRWSVEPTFVYHTTDSGGAVASFHSVETFLYIQLLAKDGFALVVLDIATGRKKKLNGIKRYSDIDDSGLMYLLRYDDRERKFVVIFLDGKSGALICQYLLEKSLWIGSRSGSTMYGTYGDRTTLVAFDYMTGELRTRVSVPSPIAHVLQIPNQNTLYIVGNGAPRAYEIGMNDENNLFPKQIEHMLDHEKYLITYTPEEATQMASRRRRCLTWCYTKQNDCRVVRYRGAPILDFVTQLAVFAYVFFQLVCFNFYSASLHGSSNVDLAQQIRGWGPTLGYIGRITTSGIVTLLLLLLMTFGDQLERAVAFVRADGSSPFLEPILGGILQLFLLVTCSVSSNALLTVFTDAYPCDTVDGVSVLAADHSIACNSSSHIVSMVFASICLALYVPLTLRSLRCNNQFKLLEKKYWYHIFYSPYDAPYMDDSPLQPFGRGSQRSYGNMVLFLTKALLNIIRVALLLRPVGVAIGNSVVGLVHLSGTTTLETFHHPLVNSANCALGIALEISYLVNIAYVNGNIEQRTANVVIASCAVCVGLVVFVIHALVTRKRARKPVKLERATTPLRWLSVPSGSDSRSGSAESTSDWGSLPASKTGSDSASLKSEASGSKSGSAASSVKSSGSGSRSSGSHSGESSS